MSDPSEPNYTNMIKVELRMQDLRSHIGQLATDLARVTQERDELNGRLNDPEYQECCQWRYKAEQERARLRALIAALPIAEGQIEVRPCYPRPYWSVWIDGMETQEFAAEDEAEAYAALLRERQGMEGGGQP